MFVWRFGFDLSLPLRNCSKVELKTQKEMKWGGELVLLHHPSPRLRMASLQVCHQRDRDG